MDKMDCGQCLYFDLIEGEEAKGFCRLKSPMWLKDGAFWPVVRRSVFYRSKLSPENNMSVKGDWCGEFKKVP